MLLRLRQAVARQRALRFEPSELLEKLAALVPRPRANLLLYHGAFAARGCWRVARATAPRAECSFAPAAEPSAAGASSPPAPPPPAAAPRPARARRRRRLRPPAPRRLG